MAFVFCYRTLFCNLNFKAITRKTVCKVLYFGGYDCCIIQFIFLKNKFITTLYGITTKCNLLVGYSVLLPWIQTLLSLKLETVFKLSNTNYLSPLFCGKSDGFLVFLKAFSWETDLWIALDDFTRNKGKNKKRNLKIIEVETKCGMKQIITICIFIPFEHQGTYKNHFCGRLWHILKKVTPPQLKKSEK